MKGSISCWGASNGRCHRLLGFDIGRTGLKLTVVFREILATEQYCSVNDSALRQTGFIAVPLSATEVTLQPNLRGSIMPSLQLKDAYQQTRYTLSQLVQLRRQMLSYARSLPRGSSERNGRRQIAASLRNLFRNKKWLDAHNLEDRE